MSVTALGKNLMLDALKGTNPTTPITHVGLFTKNANRLLTLRQLTYMPANVIRLPPKTRIPYWSVRLQRASQAPSCRRWRRRPWPPASTSDRSSGSPGTAAVAPGAYPRKPAGRRGPPRRPGQRVYAT